MKQAVMTRPGAIEFREVTEPKPGPGEVLLGIKRIGVCGSDVHVWHGKHPYTSYPVVQGHEFSGMVEAVGDGVAKVKPGEKVTAIPQILCGSCPPCLRGDEHICDRLKVQGFQAPGCAQEYFVTRVEKIVPLPSSLTFEQGALVEPAAVASHAAGRAGDLEGKNVAVLGAGPIGNLVAQAARRLGARVLITDVSGFRLEVARRCGIEHTSNIREEGLAEATRSAFGGEEFTVAFECAGSEAAVGTAIESIAKGGTIVVVGVFAEKPRVDCGLIQDRELSLIGTLMYKKADYERAVEWIASGGIATSPLDSKHFPFEEYPAAYRFIEEQRDRTMKVFIHVAP